MARHFGILSKDTNRKMAKGCILCQIDHRLDLSESVVAVPIDCI